MLAVRRTTIRGRACRRGERTRQSDSLRPKGPAPSGSESHERLLRAEIRTGHSTRHSDRTHGPDTRKGGNRHERVSAHPHHDDPGGALRVGVVPRVHVARPQAAHVGEGSPVRVRHRAGIRAGGTVPGEVLPGRDGLHRPRRRDHLPLSLRHDHARLRARRLRVDPHGRVPARAARAVRVPPLHRRARVGTGQAGHLTCRRRRAARGGCARARRTRPRRCRSLPDADQTDEERAA